MARLEEMVKPAYELLQSFFLTNDFRYDLKVRSHVERLSVYGKKYLSEKFVTQYDGKPLIHYLLSEPKHNAFTSFLLGYHHIDIDVNIEHDDICCFEVLFDTVQSLHSKLRLMQLLYERGYDVSQHRRPFTRLAEELRRKDLSPDQIKEAYRYAAILQFNDLDLILKYSEIEQVVFSLYSVRFGKIIGYQLPNMLALANNFLNSYGEFVEIFLKALKFYQKYDEVTTRDSFRNKLNSYRSNPPVQNNEYDVILEKLFPKLFEILS